MALLAALFRFVFENAACVHSDTTNCNIGLLRRGNKHEIVGSANPRLNCAYFAWWYSHSICQAHFIIPSVHKISVGPNLKNTRDIVSLAFK